MRRRARRRAPEEACGVLIGESRDHGTRTLEVMPARNVEATRARARYLLAPEDLLAAEIAARRRGLEVVGFWHSHPESAARPSAADRETAWEGYSYVIVSLSGPLPGEVTSWRWLGSAFEQEELQDAR